MLDDVQAQFEAGQYLQVVTALEGKARGAREYTLLGVALLRLSRFTEAETPLIKASVLGDPEGRVELGNLLRLLGRFEEAILHFQAIAPTLTEELQFRALRWWGVAEFQSGQMEAGLRRCERAWFGYVALGDEEMTARVAQSLGQMHVFNGDFTRAKQLYTEAVRALSMESVPIPRLYVFKGLLDLQVQTGDLKTARATLVEAKETLKYIVGIMYRADLLSSEAELLRLEGNYSAYALLLEELHPLAVELNDHNVRLWVLGRLADHYSLVGLHGKALETLMTFGGRTAEWPPELWAVGGVLARRRGEYAVSLTDLELAAGEFRRRGSRPELIRVLLHAAASALQLRAEALAVKHLKEALGEMFLLRQLVAFRPDFEELRDLLHYALLEPELAPYMEPLLDNLGHLAGAPRLPEDGAMRLQVTTLGKVAVFREGAEIAFCYTDSPLLLTYIALNPGHTRAEMQLELYPDKDAGTGSSYVRNMMRDLRNNLGPEVVTFEGPHNSPWYRLGKYVQVDLDLTHLRDALDRGDVARALALYRGDFMPPDMALEAQESDWVIQKREETRLALLFELRNQMARYKADGDDRRLVLLANQYLRVDPFEREVLETRIDAAKLVSSAQELAQYVAEFRRACN